MSVPGLVMEDAEAAWAEWSLSKGNLQEAMSRHFRSQDAMLRRLLQEPSSIGSPPESPREPRPADSQGEVFSVAPVFRRPSPTERATLTRVMPATASDGVVAYEQNGSARKSRNVKRRKDKRKFLNQAQLTRRQPITPEANALVRTMQSVFDWWLLLEEPHRSGWLYNMVHHRYFDAFVSAVIVANTAYTTFQSNYEMETLGEKPEGDMLAETTFLVIFVLELASKIAAHRVYFFCNDDMLWNIFDLTLVAFSALDQILSYGGASSGSVSFARSLRLFKMGKILRVFRAFRFLKELRVMMNSILGSFLSLFWSIITLGIILFVFALFFMQQMTNYLISEANLGDELWENQRLYFMNVQRSIATLAMCTTGGKDWEDIWVLVQPLGAFSASVFSFYIAFFTFAVMNILTGIFVENALQLCRPDDQEALTAHQKKVEKEMDELTVIMEIMDTDSSGTLSRDEFTKAMENDRVVHAMLSLGVDIKDAALFFNTLAKMNDTHEVSVDDFAAQIIRMKGAASSIDLHSLILQTTALQRDVLSIREDTVCLQRRVADLTGASSPRRGPEPHRSPARPASPTWCARRESPPRTDGQSLESDLHPVSFLGEANVSVAVPSPVSRGGTGSLH